MGLCSFYDLVLRDCVRLRGCDVLSDLMNTFFCLATKKKLKRHQKVPTPSVGMNPSPHSTFTIRFVQSVEKKALRMVQKGSHTPSSVFISTEVDLIPSGTERKGISDPRVP